MLYFACFPKQNRTASFRSTPSFLNKVIACEERENAARNNRGKTTEELSNFLLCLFMFWFRSYFPFALLLFVPPLLSVVKPTLTERCDALPSGQYLPLAFGMVPRAGKMPAAWPLGSLARISNLGEGGGRGTRGRGGDHRKAKENWS